jgi:uncharacterized protein (TIGR00375 family)
MRFIGDLHVHSHFSVATSRNLIPESLDLWARIKGIQVVGTGDFTHPGWLEELKKKLEAAEPGLFRLKKEFLKALPHFPSPGDNSDPRFILTSEISNIYKKNGRVRKIHNIIFAPDFGVVEKLQYELKRHGFNITSDGRPILGLDSRDLLEIVLTCSEQMHLVPAHIWTPWFSVLGAQSGFDTIEECYGDLSSHVYAAETGLSSDPPMNWMCSILDRYTLISNSDAHSPDKLGRNANIFNTDLSYDGIIDAMKTGDGDKFHGTIDFFPQEGKYHYAGHRKCGICWNPLETLKNNGICPVCNKPVTMGVMNRVMELADRTDVTERKNALPFYSLIPLSEILSEILGVNPGTKQVMNAYHALIRKAGSEFDILLNQPLSWIESLGDDLLTEAIRRMRNREITIREGYDGEFGHIKLFKKGEINDLKAPHYLFDIKSEVNRPEPTAIGHLSFDLSEYQEIKKMTGRPAEYDLVAAEPLPFYTAGGSKAGLNPEQQIAAHHAYGPALIIAGPGTGKTRVLAYRISFLINELNIPPGRILAITFTNKSAEEMRQRILSLIGKDKARKVTICTFHSFGYDILKDNIEKTGRKTNFSIIDEDDKKSLIHLIGTDKSRISHIADDITKQKQELQSLISKDGTESIEVALSYQSALKKHNLVDLDDLISEPYFLLKKNPELVMLYQAKYQWILIDEYQDINFAQYQLIHLLMSEPSPNLFVIGDPNQAIYGFRGARVEFIKEFTLDYPGAKIYNLLTSYRCSGNILQASHNVINEGLFRSPVLSGLKEGVKINIVENMTDKSEAEFIARTVERMMGGLRFFSIDSEISSGEHDQDIKSLSDFAVLCRMGRQLTAIEKAFCDHGIPFQSYAEEPFFRQEPVKSIIDLLKLLLNPGNVLIQQKLNNNPLIVTCQPANLLTMTSGLTVSDTLRALTENCLKKQPEENQTIFNNLFHLALTYGDDKESFLRFVVMGHAVDTYAPGSEQVSLMTLHAAKGLEFKCVFIPGCEQNLIPFSLIPGYVTDIEEERRLLYVGMTRAMKYLWLLHAKRRFLFGKELQLQRSSFLDVIELELVERSKVTITSTARKNDHQLDLF